MFLVSVFAVAEYKKQTGGLAESGPGAKEAESVENPAGSVEEKSAAEDD